MATAVITGGSTGVGAAYADRLAAEGFDLVLVARDAARLRRTAVRLRTEHAISVEVLAVDLIHPAGRAIVERHVGERPVHVLVNCAAYEARGTFPLVDRDAVQAEIDLNITAVLRLTHAVLPGMIARRGGVVINVGSMAGFLPAAGSSYGPTKAWVAAFTDSVAAALAGTGVRAVAVCPGPLTNAWGGRARKGGSRVGSLFRLTPEQVVTQSFAALARGRVVHAPGTLYAPIVGLLELPRRSLRMLARAAGVSREQRLHRDGPRPERPAPVQRVLEQRAVRHEQQRTRLATCTRRPPTDASVGTA